MFYVYPASGLPYIYNKFVLYLCVQNRYAGQLTVVRLGHKNYLDVIERSVSMGETVLIENLEESVDPVLDPIIGRNTIKKGRAVKIGDKEVEYNPSFRLILHTKLANPHYKPEMQVTALSCSVVDHIIIRYSHGVIDMQRITNSVTYRYVAVLVDFLSD